MDHAFAARSRFVPPMFFGEGGGIAAGDLAEAWLDNVRVRIRVDAVDGETLTGVTVRMEDDCRTLDAHAGLFVGAPVSLRAEHVRSCWKGAGAAFGDVAAISPGQGASEPSADAAPGEFAPDPSPVEAIEPAA